MKIWARVCWNHSVKALDVVIIYAVVGSKYHCSLDFKKSGLSLAAWLMFISSEHVLQIFDYF